MGVTSGTGSAHRSEESEFTSGFRWGSWCSIFSCMCNVL